MVELFSTFLVHVNDIPNLSRYVHLPETDTKRRLFVFDVSVNWPSNRHWQTTVLDWWRAAQMN